MPHLHQNWNEDTTRGYTPPHRIKTRTQQGAGMPLIVSKLEWEHAKDGYIPSSLCRNGTMQWEGISPLLIMSELEWKHDKEGYIPSLPCQNGTTSELEWEHDEQGYILSRHAEMGTMQPGGGLSLLVASKWQRKHNGEGYAFSLLCQNGNDMMRGLAPSRCTEIETPHVIALLT